MVVSAFLSATSGVLQAYFSDVSFAFTVANGVFSIVVIGALFAVMFKFLPDAEIGWKDVAAAALLTAILFTIGKYFGGTGPFAAEAALSAWPKPKPPRVLPAIDMARTDPEAKNAGKRHRQTPTSPTRSSPTIPPDHNLSPRMKSDRLARPHP